MKWKFNTGLLLPWGLPLGGAVVAGLAAFWLMQLYIEAYLQSHPQVTPAPSPAIQTTRVVVARHPLQQGNVLTLDNLSVRAVSPLGLAHDHIKPANVEQLIGTELAHPVAAGQPIQHLHIAPAKADKFSDVLTSGQRAYTMTLGLEQNHAGLLQVADRVDLVSTQEGRLQVLASNVSVLAVDGNMQAERMDGTLSYNNARSATFAVSLEQMARIQQQGRGAPLQVWLRAAADEQKLRLAAHRVEWIVAGQASLAGDVGVDRYEFAQGQWQ